MIKGIYVPPFIGDGQSSQLFTEFLLHFGESYKDYRSKLDDAQNAAKRAKEKQKLQNIKTKIKNL